jgi:hypothetical protein
VSTDIPVFDTMIRNSGNIVDEMQGVLFFFYANAKMALSFPGKATLAVVSCRPIPALPLNHSSNMQPLDYVTLC